MFSGGVAMWDHMQLVNGEQLECVWLTLIVNLQNFTFINFNATIPNIYSFYG